MFIRFAVRCRFFSSHLILCCCCFSRRCASLFIDWIQIWIFIARVCISFMIIRYIFSSPHTLSFFALLFLPFCVCLILPKRIPYTRIIWPCAQLLHFILWLISYSLPLFFFIGFHLVCDGVPYRIGCSTLMRVTNWTENANYAKHFHIGLTKWRRRRKAEQKKKRETPEETM